MSVFDVQAQTGGTDTRKDLGPKVSSQRVRHSDEHWRKSGKDLSKCGQTCGGLKRLRDSVYLKKRLRISVMSRGVRKVIVRIGWTICFLGSLVNRIGKAEARAARFACQRLIPLSLQMHHAADRPVEVSQRTKGVVALLGALTTRRFIRKVMEALLHATRCLGRGF